MMYFTLLITTAAYLALAQAGQGLPRRDLHRRHDSTSKLPVMTAPLSSSTSVARSTSAVDAVLPTTDARSTLVPTSTWTSSTFKETWTSKISDAKIMTKAQSSINAAAIQQATTSSPCPPSIVSPTSATLQPSTSTVIFDPAKLLVSSKMVDAKALSSTVTKSAASSTSAQIPTTTEQNSTFPPSSSSLVVPPSDSQTTTPVSLSSAAPISPSVKASSSQVVDPLAKSATTKISGQSSVSTSIISVVPIQATSAAITSAPPTPSPSTVVRESVITFSSGDDVLTTTTHITSTFFVTETVYAYSDMPSASAKVDGFAQHATNNGNSDSTTTITISSTSTKFITLVPVKPSTGVNNNNNQPQVSSKPDNNSGDHKSKNQSSSPAPSSAPDSKLQNVDPQKGADCPVSYVTVTITNTSVSISTKIATVTASAVTITATVTATSSLAVDPEEGDQTSTLAPHSSFPYSRPTMTVTTTGLYGRLNDTSVHKMRLFNSGFMTSLRCAKPTTSQL